MNKKDKPSFSAKNTYVVPPQGSLGLLAMGDKGLKAWRKARKEHNEKTNKK